MPLGDFRAGDGFGGFDPVSTGVPGPGPDAARALYFDIETRVFPVLADGTVQEVHWVDSEMALALGFDLGSIAAAPEVGTRLSRIKAATRQNVVSVTTDTVKEAVDHLTRDGSVQILSVEVDAHVRGRVLYAVTYWNRVLYPARITPTRLSLTTNS